MLEISNKDFTGQTLIERTDLDNAIMYHVCLSQENPDTVVLPPNVQGLCIAYSNLDNVAIPAGVSIGDGCSQRRFKAQPDGHDWLLDDGGNPIEMLNPPEVT